MKGGGVWRLPKPSILFKAKCPNLINGRKPSGLQALDRRISWLLPFLVGIGLSEGLEEGRFAVNGLQSSIFMIDFPDLSRGTIFCLNALGIF